MAITFLQAKKRLARYMGIGGKCITASTEEFVLEVLQYMLYQGTDGNLRTFSFYAKNGCITLPYELETPLKVKVENVVGNVFTSFFSYHSNMRMDECDNAFDALYDEPNHYPTVYDLPLGGGCPGIIATCTEDPTSFVIVKGEDLTGRDIFTTHQGEEIHGVKLTPQKGKCVYTNVKFGKITEVIKSPTKGYVQLLALDDIKYKHFLADYSPIEETPSYRRMRLKTARCPEKARVTILGRIRLKQAYADLDLIPFDNFYALSIAGQAVNANYNGDADTGTKKDQILEKLIEKEGNYKKPNNGQALEVFPLTAGSNVRNMFNRKRLLRGRR